MSSKQNHKQHKLWRILENKESNYERAWENRKEKLETMLASLPQPQPKEDMEKKQEPEKGKEFKKFKNKELAPTDLYSAYL